MTTGGFSLVELRESVAKAIEGLPEKQREVVVLKYWEGLSYDEIARRLGSTEGTVGWLLCEAVNRLHDRLKPHLETEPPKKEAEGKGGAG